MMESNAIVPSISDMLRKSAASSEYLYMLIDTAQDPRIYPALVNSPHTRCCLFSEEQISDDVKAVSPFVVKIKRCDDFVSWCLREGLLRNWMVFFSSPQIHVSELRLHFKRYALAQTPDGKRYFFRYYDPRVLITFIAACDPKERQALFRQCRTFWIPQMVEASGVQWVQIAADGQQTILNNLTELRVA